MKNKYLHWVGWLMSVIAFAYLVYRLATYDNYADLALFLHQAGQREWWSAIIACVLIPIQLLVEACRWQWFMQGWKNITLRESWYHVIVGALAGFITPYKIGDIPARVLAAGVETDIEKIKQHGRDWVKDKRKWLPIVGWTIVRYIIWGFQLWGVLTFVGIYLTPWQAMNSIAIYYFLISIMPSLPAAEVVLKGGWAVLIFGQYTENVAAITLAVSIIWIFNTIIPVLFGSLEKILYFCRQK